MLSSTSNFSRDLPSQRYGRIAIVVVLLSMISVIGWELYVRHLGYAPTLNDTADLWVEKREQVESDSLVIVGSSRPLFNLDLATLEKGLGQEPIQLALVGSCAYPILEDLALDEGFAGKLIVDIAPSMYFAPAGPLLETSWMALKRRAKQTPSERIGHLLGVALEQRLAFLQQEDLTLEQLLKRLPIANRPYAFVAPPLPPYFATIDRQRQARMIEACAEPGPLQKRVSEGWIPLFTPPPPYPFIPQEAYMAFVKEAIEKRFADTVAAVETIRNRGGQVVFVRFPSTHAVRELEAKYGPRDQTWEPLLAMTQAPGIHFEDHPELADFECPEWSHLSAEDAIAYTERLVPHLKAAFGQ